MAKASLTTVSVNSVSDHSEPIGTEQPTVKPSKQLNYYYRHRQDRLSYQRDYYQKHKTKILINKHHRDQLIKVKRTKNNISLIHNMRNNSYTVLKDLNRHDITNKNLKWFKETFLHGHGKPNNSQYAIKVSKEWTPCRFWFHVIPELAVTDNGKVLFSENCEFPENENIITARELSIQTCHFLGLKWGTSIYWKEYFSYNSLAWGKVQTDRVVMHSVCFDGSGLDTSHPQNLPSLIACAVETGLKGMDLLNMFAYRHSVNNYLQVFRGNRLLQTSETENAYRDYAKHFPIVE